MASTTFPTQDDLRNLTVSLDTAFHNLIGFQSSGIGPNDEHGWVLLCFVERVRDKDPDLIGLPPGKNAAKALTHAFNKKFKAGGLIRFARAIEKESVTLASEEKTAKAPLYLSCYYTLWPRIPELINFVLRLGYRAVLHKYGLEYRPEPKRDLFDPAQVEDRLVYRAMRLVQETNQPPKLDQFFWEFAWHTPNGRAFARLMCTKFPDRAPTAEEQANWNAWKWPEFHDTCRKFKVLNHCDKWWFGPHKGDPTDTLYLPTAEALEAYAKRDTKPVEPPPVPPLDLERLSKLIADLKAVKTKTTAAPPVPASAEAAPAPVPAPTETDPWEESGTLDGVDQNEYWPAMQTPLPEATLARLRGVRY